MPFDEPLRLPARPSIAVSAATELSWLVIACSKRNAVHQIDGALERDVDAFWGDGLGMLTEPLNLAQQLGCLTGWDIEPLLSIEDQRIDAKAELGLETEDEHERTAVRERLERLAADRKVRRAYGELLRAVWRDAEPQLRFGPPSWRWLIEAFASTRRLRGDSRLKAMRVPVLMLIATADKLVDPKAAAQVAAKLPDARVVRFGKESAHEILREADPVRNRAIGEIDIFLAARAKRA